MVRCTVQRTTFSCDQNRQCQEKPHTVLLWYFCASVDVLSVTSPLLSKLLGLREHHNTLTLLFDSTNVSDRSSWPILRPKRSDAGARSCWDSSWTHDWYLCGFYTTLQSSTRLILILSFDRFLQFLCSTSYGRETRSLHCIHAGLH